MLSTAAIVAGAQLSEADTRPTGRRTALSGYDPLSHFTDGRPEKGSDVFLFAADLERHAPRYSGFCASGVSKGYKIESDPEAWVIANGKLYVLMLKERVPDFQNDAAAFVDKADANWPQVRNLPIGPR